MQNYENRSRNKVRHKTAIKLSTPWHLKDTINLTNDVI